MKHIFGTKITHFVFLFLFVLILCSALTGCRTSVEQTDYSNYKTIDTVDDLRMIRENLNGRYLLTADLDLSEASWNPIGEPDQPFLGIFDGNGHHIRNMTVDCSGSGDITGGLFGQISHAVVRNVQIENSKVMVHVTGDESSAIAAGVVGWAIDNSIVEQCSFSGSITGISDDGVGYSGVGGIVGILNNSRINNCYSNANLRAESSVNSILIAGICSLAMNDSSVECCYSAGRLFAKSGGEEGICYAGGLAALANSSVVRSSVVLLEQIMLEGSTVNADEISCTGISENNAVVRGIRSNYSLRKSMDTLRVSRFSSMYGRFYCILGWDMQNIWEIPWGRMPQLRCQ